MDRASRGNFWGKLIRDLREEQNVTQRQLASRAAVNRSTLRRIEDGTARGDIDIMERLLSYLGYELEAMSRESLGERLKVAAQSETDPSKRSRLARTRLLTMMVIGGPDAK